MQKPISFIIFYREQKKPREGVKPSRGIFVSAGSPAAESRDVERGTRAALSVLVCIRFAFGFNQSDIFWKIENGGFNQFVQAVRIKGKALFEKSVDKSETV